MIRLTEIIGKPSLKYHIDNSLSLYENVYRYSSDSFIQLFAEARDAYRDGKIQLNEEDLKLIETTDIGLYGVYEGIKVPLDLPMLEESKYDKEETIQQTIDRLKARIADPNDGGNVPFLVQKLKDLEKSLVKKEGLWANINAKKKAGKKPSHGNSNAHKDAEKAGNKLKP